MLGRLLKYEFKATARLFLPFYLLLIVLALFNRFFNFKLLSGLEPQTFYYGLSGILAVLVGMAYGILIVGVMVLTLLVMIKRFYQSLLGNEGYLMFTLPVHPWQHIVAKLVTALVWTLASGLVTAASILLVSAQVKPAELWSGFLEAIHVFGEDFGTAGFFLLPGTILISIIAGILMIYSAIALGHLSSRHRLLASFAWFAALYLALTSFPIALFFFPVASHFAEIAQSADPAALFQQMIFWTGFIPSLIFGAFNFCLTNHILNRRLNLE